MIKYNSIPHKKLLTTLFIILIIFSIGFYFRVDTVNLNGIPDTDKPYYQDDNGLPYAYELDSYYNYRLTKNYLDHGYLGDTIINGVEYDLHSYYPPGVPLDYPPLIAYLTAFVYKFVNLFGDVPLLIVCFWLSAFIAPLAGIVAYFFVGRFTNQYGAVAAGILTVTIPLYFMRTLPGWFDTDMFNLVFPFLVVWFLFEAFDNTNKSTKKGIIFSFLAAVSIFLFSMAWNGWQYLFYIIIIFWVINLIWTRFKGKNVKNLLYNFCVFMGVSLVLVGVFTGFINIIKLILVPLQLFTLSGGGAWPDWPNVYITVSELGIPSFEEIFLDVGITLFAGIFGLIWGFWILLNDKRHKKFLDKMNWLSYSFLVLWTIAGFVTLYQGMRFIMILIPPLLVSTGIMIGICVEHLDLLKNSKRIHIFKRKPGLLRIIAIIILLLAVMPGIMHLEKGIVMVPGTNDDMWEASLWINNNTSNKTVIISDWSDGHIYTAIADRPVSEDGRMGYLETLPVRNYDDLYPFKNKSPSTSRDYWICKALSTDNESLSLGILHMISTSGDEGYIKLDMYVKNTTKTVEIMNSILGLNQSVAREILINTYNLEENQADEVLKYTHPENPSPMVLVTNERLVGTGHWIFKFGEWDFNEKRLNNYTYSVGKVTVTDNVLNSTNEVFMDLETGNITWENKTPYCVVFVNNGTLEKNYLDPASDFCLFIIENKKSVIIDKRFENSIFTKLVLEKSKSTAFKPLYENKNVVVWGTPT